MKLRKTLAVFAAGILAAPVAQADPAVALLQQINDSLASSGTNVRVEYLEYYTTADAEQMGRVVFASDRGNKQLALQFVPGDLRRAWSYGDPNTIEWSYDTVDITGDVSAAAQRQAHYDAMATWDSQKCSEYGLNGFDVPVDQGVVQSILGFGGGFLTADIMHSGFLPGGFFDLLAPGGSNFILGVSFSFLFIDPAGNPTDVDNNGYFDKAFGDNYYNDNFFWKTDANAPGIDIETVVLHEAGHGHGQAHFGDIFVTPSNGKVHFAPRAVMNAAYSGVQRSLTGTDRGGHCAQWANWPNQ